MSRGGAGEVEEAEGRIGGSLVQSMFQIKSGSGLKHQGAKQGEERGGEGYGWQNEAE